MQNQKEAGPQSEMVVVVMTTARRQRAKRRLKEDDEMRETGSVWRARMRMNQKRRKDSD